MAEAGSEQHQADDDKRFAEEAVKRGFATESQVTNAATDQEMFAERGYRKSLSDILVEKGLVSRTQAETIKRSTLAGESKTLGHYELLEKLGEGGMGTVYRAKHTLLEQVVAIKVLADRIADDPQFVARFLREARSAARLKHPNVIQVMDVGEVDGRYYMAMEFVKGESAGDLLKREGHLSERRATEITVQVARVLEHAASQGIIHRDIKPDNIMLSEDGTVKVADLGLAKRTDEESTNLTRTGTAMGTPLYISPEQARGDKDIDIRADVYSLGATYYHFLTGQPAFEGSTAAVIITKHLTEIPLPANQRASGITEDATAIVSKMMAKDRESRYSPTVLIGDLENLLEGLPPEAASTPAIAGATLMDAADLQQVRREALAATGARTAFASGGRRIIKYVLPAAVVGIAAAIAVVLFLRSREPEPTVAVLPPVAAPEEAPGTVQADAAEEAEAARLEAASERFVSEVRKLFEEGRLDEASTRLSVKPHGIEKTTHVAEMEHLALAIGKAISDRKEARRKEEEERRAEAERRRIEEERLRVEEEKRKADEAFAALLAGADEDLRAGKFPSAEAKYEEAMRQRPSGELRTKLDEVRFTWRKSEGAAAEKAGRLDKAISKFRVALGFKDDPEVAERVEMLENRASALEHLKEASLLARAGSFDSALQSARKALAFAPKGTSERSKSQKLVAALEKRKLYSDRVAAARSARDRGDWAAVETAARRALEIGIGGKEATELVKQAELHLRPPEITNSIGVKLVRVEGTTFSMGSGVHDEDERPPHTVELSTFYIGKFEVNNSQFERIFPKRGSERPEFSPGSDSPVVNVTWDEAMKFCQRLSSREGKTYRLPTEAEWEYAARGKTGRKYPWGNSEPDEDGRYVCNLAWSGSRSDWSVDGYEYTAPIGSFRWDVAVLGCFDMAGNVREWCMDWYAADYYASLASDVADPRGPSGGEARVVRGGSFATPADFARSTSRSKKKAVVMAAELGFRVVLEVEE